MPGRPHTTAPVIGLTVYTGPDPGAPGPCTVISMRRFFARLAGVSFGATGWVSPNPLAEMMFGLTPCEIRKVTMSPARRDDKVRLSLIPARFSGAPTGKLSV